MPQRGKTSMLYLTEQGIACWREPMIAPSEAVDLFAQIYMRGIFYRALALILGQPRRLRRLALAERSGVRRYDGVYSVPL